MNIATIKSHLTSKFLNDEFVIDKTGVKTVEIVNASFIADQPIIFGKENTDYIERELEWYKSLSLNVNDIPPPIPAIWKSVASSKGLINSNYGYLIFHKDNFYQAECVVEELLKNSSSRRAVMIYTRPSMHDDWNTDGMSDFICTNAVQYLIRNNKLEVVVQMRSNDAVFGYKNDYAWQKSVQDWVIQQYNKLLQPHECISAGNIHWNVASLHVYERHFEFIKEYIDLLQKTSDDLCGQFSTYTTNTSALK